MEISKNERIILYNQFEILKKLSPQEDWLISAYETNQEILLHGYKHEYGLVMEGYNDDLPEDVSHFVWDVLQLYQIFFDSYRKLTPSEKKEIDVSEIKYYGFDEKSEYQYFRYCHFILERLKRYNDIRVKGQQEHDARRPTLRKYRHMVETWKQVRTDRYGLLTKDQIQKILQS